MEKPQIITVGDFEGEIVDTKHGLAERRHSVKRLKGEWPTDDELLKACDGGKPESAHFGGSVAPAYRAPDHRVVTVYTD